MDNYQHVKILLFTYVFTRTKTCSDSVVNEVWTTFWQHRTCAERSRGKILLSSVVVVPFRCRCLWSLLLYLQISSIELKFRWPQFQTLIVGRSSGECLGILRNQITNLPMLGNERNNFTRQPKHLHKLIKISRPEVTNEQSLHTTCISVHFK